MCSLGVLFCKSSLPTFKFSYFSQKIKIWLRKFLNRAKNIFFTCVYMGVFGVNMIYYYYVNTSFLRKSVVRGRFFTIFCFFQENWPFFNNNSRSIGFLTHRFHQFIFNKELNNFPEHINLKKRQCSLLAQNHFSQ